MMLLLMLFVDGVVDVVVVEGVLDGVLDGVVDIVVDVVVSLVVVFTRLRFGVVVKAFFSSSIVVVSAFVVVGVSEPFLFVCVVSSTS